MSKRESAETSASASFEIESAAELALDRRSSASSRSRTHSFLTDEEKEEEDSPAIAAAACPAPASSASSPALSAASSLSRTQSVTSSGFASSSSATLASSEIPMEIVPAPVAVRSPNKINAHQRTPSGRIPPWKLNLDELERYRKPAVELQTHRRETRRFYKHQNQLIQLFSDMDQVHHGYQKLTDETNADHNCAGDSAEVAIDVHAPTDAAGDGRMPADVQVRLAIYLSLIANFLLLVLKVIAFIQSGSLSVLASALDSFLDLLSGAILFITARLTRGENRYKYPAGKKRIEPVGVIVFSTAMFTATLQLVVETVQQLATNSTSIKITIFTLVIISVTVIVKFILWVYCTSISTRSGAVRALAVDHRNDVFTNMFGMTTAILGAYLYWVIDPIGALMLAAYLLYIWGSTLLEQVRMMAGQAAPDSFHRAITYLCWNHHPLILQIDTVRAYHLSQDYMVEVDVVLPENMSLRESHDIGESLQFKLESLDRVERAFVHLDYETSHKPEH